MADMVSRKEGADREIALARYRLYAGLLLLFAALAWVLIHYAPLPPTLLGYIRAASEAAMVGGLADWFAVTALFRHPLGLPIPHTRLIPRNQPRIADGVAAYIDREFLQHDVLATRIRSFDIADRLGRLLDRDETRQKLIDGLMRFLPRMLDERSSPGALDAVANAVRSGIAGSDLRPTVARLARLAIGHPDFDALIDNMAGRTHDWLRLNRETIRERVGSRSYWFIPRFVDRHIADKTVGGLADMLAALEDRHSEERAELRRWIWGLPEGIERATGPFEQVPEFLRRAIDNEGASAIVAAALANAKDALLADLKSPGSKMREALDTISRSLAAQLDSHALRKDINATVEAFITDNVPAWRDEVRRFIVEVLSRQQPEEFARRIELQVGKDLQFIRINGTIFGALVGAGIHFINKLF